MSNIPPFYVGQKVVCVDGSPEHGLHKGETYILTDVKMCKCGYCSVSWGSKSGRSKLTCPGCKNDMSSSTLGEWYGKSTRFRPVQEQKFHLISYSKVLEEVVVGAN